MWSGLQAEVINGSRAEVLESSGQHGWETAKCMQYPKCYVWFSCQGGKFFAIPSSVTLCSQLPSSLLGFCAFLALGHFLWLTNNGSNFSFHYFAGPWWIGCRVWGDSNRVFQVSKTCQILAEKVSPNCMCYSRRSIPNVFLLAAFWDFNVWRLLFFLWQQ
jgi:hypothetical protein